MAWRRDAHVLPSLVSKYVSLYCRTARAMPARPAGMAVGLAVQDAGFLLVEFGLGQYARR